MRQLRCALIMLGASWYHTDHGAAHAMVIHRVTGPDEAEIANASAGGGMHLIVTGTDLGSPFSPPIIRVGVNGDAECVVQGFLSTRNRMYCVISADGLPAPTPAYSSSSSFQSVPLYAYRRSDVHNDNRADCWHVGGLNHGCFLRFDLGGTPRLSTLLTPLLQSGSKLRAFGHGLAGSVATRLSRDEGGQSLGCRTHDSESGIALAHFNLTQLGCELEAIDASFAGGRFNISLGVSGRGDAYKAPASRQIDLERGSLFDAELLPRITSITPTIGSVAGGTDLTVRGFGFGSNEQALSVSVGGVKCEVLSLAIEGLRCRVKPRQTGSTAVGPFPGERGVRWEWKAAGGNGNRVSTTGRRTLLGVASTPDVWEATTPPPPQPLLERISATMSYDDCGYGRFFPASKCLDNLIYDNFCHSCGNKQDPWFSVLISAGFLVTGTRIFNRVGSSEDRLFPYEIWVGDREGHTGAGATFCGAQSDRNDRPGPFDVACPAAAGTYVTLLLPGSSRTINMAEFEVTGTLAVPPSPPGSASLGQPDWGMRSSSLITGWFEAPCTCDVSFLLRLDGPSQLHWGRGEQPEATELLAEVASGQSRPILVEGWYARWSTPGDYSALGLPDITTRIATMAVEFHASSRAWTTLDASHGFNLADRFVARFTYQFVAPSSGECTFTCTADDLCALFVDGALVVKTDSLVVQAEYSGKLSLVAGRWYSAEVQFVEFSDAHERLTAANIALYWHPAGFSTREVMHPGVLVWPQWPEHADSPAISRKVSLIEGRSYWLSLNCSNSEAPCGMGARVHTAIAPTALSVDKRPLQARVKSTGECHSILDRGQCCAHLDKHNQPCVPATTQFSNNIYCHNYAIAVSQYDVSLLAACPATAGRTGTTTTTSSMSAPAREILPTGTGCNSLRDRTRCATHKIAAPQRAYAVPYLLPAP